MTDTHDTKYFTESKLYPIIFMIVITVIFVGVLSTFYQLTKGRVETHKQHQLHKMILETFKLQDDPVEQNYNKYITEAEHDDLKYFIARKNNSIVGYCFPVEGNGLWGSIHVLIAFDPDLMKLIGFSIIEQNETPGLGARITEDWFLAQFEGKSLVHDDAVVQFKLIPEDETPEANEVNQITGATSSSRAVVNLLYKHTKRIREEFRNYD